MIRDLLKLSVHEDTVRRVLIKNHLERTSLPPVKPIRRFRANEPNELWQIDIQGKVHFPLIGDLLLILVKDDHRPRTKGKIENQFRFVQRDFVLVNLHYTCLEDLNATWEKWMEWYDWKHRHKGLNRDSPADHYVKSQRRPTAEELELLLIHEEPRNVTRTGHITYYGQFYRVPDPYIWP